MIDNRLVLAATDTIQVLNNTGVLVNWVNNSVTVGGKTASALASASNTSYLLIKDNDLLGASLSFGAFGSMVMYFMINGATTTGSPTAIQIPWTITFSDDGSSQASNSQTITGTANIGITSNAQTSNYAGYLRLPSQFNHKYIRVAWGTITFTGGTTPTVSTSSANWKIGIGVAPWSRDLTDMG